MNRKSIFLTAKLAAICSGSLLAAIAGCHSPYVEVTIDNRGSSPLRLIEVDYPSASFGVGNLAAYSQYHYRFKVQGSGALKIEFTDAAGQIRDVDGPEVSQGQEGPLLIVIDKDRRVTWNSRLAAVR